MLKQAFVYCEWKDDGQRSTIASINFLDDRRPALATPK